MEEYNVSFENEEIQTYIEDTFLNADEALENAQQEDASSEEESEGAPTEENAEEEEAAETDESEEADSEEHGIKKGAPQLFCGAPFFV